jgi:hypothetical protein
MLSIFSVNNSCLARLLLRPKQTVFQGLSKVLLAYTWYFGIGDLNGASRFDNWEVCGWDRYRDFGFGCGVSWGFHDDSRTSRT